MALCLAASAVMANDLPAVPDAVVEAEDLWTDHDEFRYRRAQGQSPWDALADLSNHGFGGISAV